jgi:hypothetical protein
MEAAPHDPGYARGIAAQRYMWWLDQEAMADLANARFTFRLGSYQVRFIYSF